MNQTKINRYLHNALPLQKHRHNVGGLSVQGFPITYLTTDDKNQHILDDKKINEDQTRRLKQFTDRTPIDHERSKTRNAKVADYCKICGECAFWVDGTDTKQTHNKKSCPYEYYYGVKNIHTYKVLMLNVDDTTGRWDKTKILDLKEDLKTQTNFTEALEISLKNAKHLIETREKEVEVGVMISNDLMKKLKEETDNSKIYKEIFSIEEIQKRKETYAMEKEQMAMMNEEMEAKELTFKERESKLIIKEKAIDDKVKDKTEEANLTISAYQQRGDRKDKQIEYYRKLYENSNESINNVKEYLSKALADNKVLEMRHKQDKDLMEESFRENTILENRLDKYLLTKDRQDNYEGHSCSICCENIQDEKGTTTECGHHFHTKCYTSFMKNEFKSKSYGEIKCPNCRHHIADIN